MDDNDPRKGAPSLLMKYFGKKHGQGLSDFATEIKALSDDDIRQLRKGIEDGTLTY